VFKRILGEFIEDDYSPAQGLRELSLLQFLGSSFREEVNGI
jgi:hypothetical protein